MLLKERLNARLLFILSFSITALAIYIFKLSSSGNELEVPHNFLLNVLFINITFLGSSIFCIGLIVYLFYLKHKSIAWLSAISCLMTIVAIQVIKNYMQNDGVQIFFEDDRYIPNGSNNFTRLFISSHTALAFTLATIYTLYFNNKFKSILLFVAALMVAYSRLYFSPHTIFDLLGSTFAGVASASLTYYFFLNRSKFRNGYSLIEHKYSKIKIPFKTLPVE